MIATAHPGPIKARITNQQLQPDENLLLVSYDRFETDCFDTWLNKNYRLFLAATERRILTLLQAHAIHLIIINTGPATIAAGLRLCSRLKSAPQSAHLPMILLMAGNDPDARLGCLRAGADACIEKPLSGEHLRAQVRNLLANRLLLQSYFSQPAVSAIQPTMGTGENMAFVRRLNEFISANLHDAGLNVDLLAQRMNISRPTLYRRIRHLSKRTPNELVNYIRLNKAAELLSAGEHKIFRIAQMVGFSSRSNFGRCFVRQFGLTPKEYVQLVAKV